MDRKKNIIMYSAIFIVLLLLSIWIIKPFILSIIAGILVAYIFYPVHKWLLKKIKRPGWSAFIVAILIILIFTVPIILMANALVKDAYVSYVIVKQKVSSSLFVEQRCDDPGLGCDLINWLQTMIPPSQLKYYFEEGLSRIAQWSIDKGNEVISRIPSLGLQLIVMLFVIYYSLKEGKNLIKKFFSMLELRAHHADKLMKKTKDMIGSTIYGMLVVAAIQGTFAGVGYFIFGISSPVLLGILTALAALIPVLGTAIVWAPTVGLYFVNALVSNDSTGIMMSLGLLAYSIFPVSTIDNFIRPKIIGDRAKVHPILVLLGALGGLAAFGIMGVLLGPIIITLFVIFIDIYQEEKQFVDGKKINLKSGKKE